MILPLYLLFLSIYWSYFYFRALKALLFLPEICTLTNGTQMYVDSSKLTSWVLSNICFFFCLSLITWALRASHVALGIFGRSMNNEGTFSVGPPSAMGWPEGPWDDPVPALEWLTPPEDIFKFLLYRSSTKGILGSSQVPFVVCSTQPKERGRSKQSNKGKLANQRADSYPLTNQNREYRREQCQKSGNLKWNIVFKSTRGI